MYCFLCCFFWCRLQDTLLHTHRLTAAGMKPLVPLLVPVCGTPPRATHLLVLPPLAGTHRAMPHLDMVEPQEAFGRTAGMKPQRQNGRRPDTGAAGLRPHARTEETRRWARLRPRAPARGSLVGTKRQQVSKWDPQHLCSPLERHQLEHLP